jgi:hypothetical protein
MSKFRVLWFLAFLLVAPQAFAQSCPQQQINAQTGTSYTVLNSDNCKKVSFSNGSAVAVTLPQAGASGNFGNTWSTTFVNIGAGAVTITPTTSTIDGLSSRVLQQYQALQVTSNGTNYISAGLPPVYGSGLTYSAGTLTAPGTSNSLTTGIEFVIDGGGSALTTSTCSFTSGQLCVLEIPFACTITAARLFADQTGSVVIEIAKTTYSAYAPGTHPVSGDKITSSTPPTISSAAKAQDTTLTSWTTSVSAGDVIGFSVTSATTITRVTVSLTCVKT